MTQLQSEYQLSEDDEQLFSSARAALLAAPTLEVDGPTPKAASDSAGLPKDANADASDKRARKLGHSLLLLAAALCLLARWKPQTFSAAAGWGVLLYLGVVFGYFIRQGKALNAAKKRNDQVIDPGTVSGGNRTFLSSAIVALLIGFIFFSPVEVFWFFVTILFHESGHYLAMRLFGYRGVRMAFTYTGAVVNGEKENAPAWQQATVLLMGPLPGLIVGCGLYFLNLPARSPFLHAGAAWLVTLNFINLMPLAYADGEKLVGLLLFQRSPAVLTKIVIPAIFCSIYLICDHGWLAVALTAMCLLMFVPGSYKLAASVDQLSSRWRNLPSRMKEMTEEQWRDLFKIARQRYTKAPLGWGFCMKTIYDYAIVRPARLNVALAFGGVYLLAIALAVTCASTTQLRTDAGRWPIIPMGKLGDPKPGEPWKQVVTIESFDRPTFGGNPPKGRPDAIGNYNVIAFLDDHRFAVADGQHPIRVFSADDGKALLTFGQPEKDSWSPRQFVVSTDGRFLALLPDSEPAVWDTQTGNLVCTLPPFKDKYSFATFLADRHSLVTYRGEMARGSVPDNLQVWDVNERTRNSTLVRSINADVDARALSLVGPYVLLRNYRRSEVFDAKTFEIVLQQSGDTDEEFLCIQPPSTIAGGAYISLVLSYTGCGGWTTYTPEFRMLSLPGGRQIRRWKCPMDEHGINDSRYQSLYTVSPNRTVIAISQRGRIDFFNLQKGIKIRSFAGNTEYASLGIVFFDEDYAFVTQQRQNSAIDLVEISSGRTVMSIPESDFAPIMSPDRRGLIARREWIRNPADPKSLTPQSIVLWKRINP